MEIDPNFFFAHHFLGQSYLQKGMIEQVLLEFQKTGRDRESYPYFALAYVAQGNRRDAQKVLEKYKERAKRGPVNSVATARICAALGQNDLAFRWLDKAYQDMPMFLPWLKVDPEWDSLRSDPRLRALLERLGLPP